MRDDNKEQYPAGGRCLTLCLRAAFTLCVTLEADRHVSSCRRLKRLLLCALHAASEPLERARTPIMQRDGIRLLFHFFTITAANGRHQGQISTNL